jgi:hypothetical protein
MTQCTFPVSNIFHNFVFSWLQYIMLIFQNVKQSRIILMDSSRRAFLNLITSYSPANGWSALRKASANYAEWLWWWRSWWNERFWQGKPKYSEKTYPDATLSTTNPTFQTRAQSWAAAVRSQRLTTSAMTRPKIITHTLDYPCYRRGEHALIIGKHESSKFRVMIGWPWWILSLEI